MSPISHPSDCTGLQAGHAGLRTRSAGDPPIVVPGRAKERHRQNRNGPGSHLTWRSSRFDSRQGKLFAKVLRRLLMVINPVARDITGQRRP